MAVILGIVPRMRRRIAGSFLQKTARARALAFVRTCAWLCAGAWTLPSMRADARVSWRGVYSTRPVGSYLGSACAQGRLVAECGRVRHMSA